MKKTLIVLSCSVLLITGCAKKPQEQQEVSKTPFFITTENVDTITTEYMLEKSGKIVGAQDIIVTSQVGARVQSITPRIGETVTTNQRVVSLADSNGTYSFAVQRAKAALDQAKINYDQTMLSLNKSITDTQLALNQAQNQAERSEVGQQNTTANAQLAQIDEQIANAEYDYETRLIADNQTIDNYINAAENIVDDVQVLYQDVVTETDKILGVSSLYEDKNDAFEQLLWARNTALKTQAQTELRILIQQEDRIEQFDDSFSEETLSSKLNELKNLLDDLIPFLTSLETMLTYTSTNSTFADSRLEGLRTTVNALQTRVQTQVSAITQQANAIESFLSTYEQQQESLLNSIQVLRAQRQAQQESLEDVSFNADIGLEGAQNTYQNTLKTKDTTEIALRNAIQQAQISYNEAVNEQAKLSVEAPIAGTIWEIFVDEGQEVMPGTQLFSLSSIEDQEIEIALTSDEVQLVTEGALVTVVNGDALFSGTLASITRTAGSTLTYKAIVILDETADLIWGVATVQIPIASPYPLIPVKFVTIINQSQGTVTTRNGNTLEQLEVQLGKIRGSSIEIRSTLPASTQIVTSDVSNFDEARNEIQVKATDE